MVLEAFEGFVLTGGASRRFGSDKSIANFGRERMGSRVIAALKVAGASTIRTVGGVDRGFDVAHLHDVYPGDGPLGGVVSALGAASSPIAFVAACDLPVLDAATVRRVLGGLGEFDVAVAHTNRDEPLCAAYRVEACRNLLEQVFLTGERSMHGALKRLRIARVDVSHRSVLINVNTLDDHAAALAFANMSVEEISVDELAERLNDGATVFDVREPHEWAEVRVPGAILIPLGDVPESLDAFPADGDVLVICRSGARSMRACEWLAGQGRSAVNIAGGTMAWVARGFQTDQGSGAL
jgi:molybdopterin-guanine dinucleotide biosynthesis protein A/rhodanese-related sulfurtransferase